MLRPGLAVCIENPVRALSGLSRLESEGLGAGGLDLHADELGAVGLAVLLQPVGVHQPRGVVVGVGEDRGEKCVAVGHRHFTSMT